MSRLVLAFLLLGATAWGETRFVGDSTQTGEPYFLLVDTPQWRLACTCPQAIITVLPGPTPVPHGLQRKTWRRCRQQCRGLDNGQRGPIVPTVED